MIPAVYRLTGEAKYPNPHSRLCVLYYFMNRFLQKFPEECNYRKNTQIIINQRQSILQCTKDLNEIEKMVACGRFSQLISQADGEFALMKQLLFYKPWEPLISTPPANQWTWPFLKQ